MVNFRYYDPKQIFQDENALLHEMTGSCNRAVAKSFIHSRNLTHTQAHQCNPDTHNRGNQYDRNAGAAQLYYKNGTDIYQISGVENKEYHCVSYGNKYFKDESRYDADVQKEATSYGHSERILMRDILDDLIKFDKSSDDSYTIPPRPSDQGNSEYKILKYLTNNASKYKEYLEHKNLIVKMWSERPACNEESNENIGGGNCNSFINDICPEGSQFGFIVQNYTRDDNKLGVPKVRDAFNAFTTAYTRAYPQDDIGVLGAEG